MSLPSPAPTTRPSPRARAARPRRPLAGLALAAASCCRLRTGFLGPGSWRAAAESAEGDKRPERQQAAVKEADDSGVAGESSVPTEGLVGMALALAASARLGTATSGRETARTKRAVARSAIPQVDWLGTSTPWGAMEMEEKPLSKLDWRNVHGIFTIMSIALFAFQIGRIALHQAPSIPEVWITTAVYLPWTALCWRDTAKLEEHYRVTFYASCGWALMSLASLHSVVYQDKYPELAFQILVAGNVVFGVACAYFYGYHWSRMWRHFQQNRFRPLWIPGLVGLMALHGLTVADFVKRLDDPGWWKTVCQIYSDEWWWVADVRIIELFVTAAALWLIILHIQGVFTGMKNAALVVSGTIFTPVVVMVLESTWLRASAWQHYLMVGPKYW